MIAYELINPGSSIALSILDKKDSGKRFCFSFELIVFLCVCAKAASHVE